jgi:hypothetical protein
MAFSWKQDCKARGGGGNILYSGKYGTLPKKEIPLLHEHATSATPCNHCTTTQLTNSDWYYPNMGKKHRGRDG